MTENRVMFGRRVIYTDFEDITRDNVCYVLNQAMGTHTSNRSEIEYLYNYYKGKQPIIYREKKIRPEINNIVVENRANEIVSFKVGYLMGEPLQYVSRGGNDDMSEAINLLNEYVFAEDKACKDKELAEWFFICGTAYRMILPDEADEEDESPFEIYTLNPMNTFVVYSNGLGNKPVMGVRYVVRDDNTVIYSVYTKDKYFEIVDGIITSESAHILGDIPIIEYPANNARLGAFEACLSLLDCINKIQSNRLDGIEQFIQALLVLKGVNIDDEDAISSALQELGIAIPENADVKYLVQELNQSQTQTLVDNMYQAVRTICGMPSQADGGTSDSSNNGAVILKNGWQSAEARAKDTELTFKKSEKQFLKLAISIANTMKNLNLKLSGIEIRFTRRNYENIQEKAQVLAMMLSNDKIHPRLAFEHSGMFADPEIAYTSSMEYYEQNKKEIEKELEQFSQNSIDEEIIEEDDEESV